jgi:uncharacterized protein (TIGR04551 family)
VKRAAATLLLTPTLALATGFTDHGEDLVPREKAAVTVDGYFRARGEWLYDLDLDRGLTPEGRALFPVPLGDPTAQSLTGADARLRTDLAVYAPGGSLAVKLRADVLDGLPLGGSPELSPGAGTAPTPAASAGQRPAVLRVKRAYAEALTPFGLLAVGRMGAHFGLGLAANGGDCADCDGGDSADRVAFMAPMLGHIVALAYDFTAGGPTTPRRDGIRVLDLDPTDDVRTATVAVLRWRDDASRARRAGAGKATFDYGLALSHRWQDNDVPAWYLPTAAPVPLGPSQVMRRGYRATSADAWIRVVTPSLRVEAEAAVISATVEQASLVPGVLLRDQITATQWGGALESEYGAAETGFRAGLDLGVASGDPAPGFGAFPGAGTGLATPGELDGPQASPPHDSSIDNFRFHPDYRIDRILFRELIGTVTDAVYLRPHARLRAFAFTSGELWLSLAAIGSRAIYASSTPGSAAPLGIELDPTLEYRSRDGFSAALEHAVLFPLAGLDNPAAGLSAQPAQLLRLRLLYRF